jgi:hypothetical protein
MEILCIKRLYEFRIVWSVGTHRSEEHNTVRGKAF